MSGSFENLDVPPTLISFAVTTAKTSDIITNDFKKAGHSVILLSPEYGSDGLPVAESLIKLYDTVNSLFKSGCAVSAYTPGYGGIAEAVFKACLGNGFGFEFDSALSLKDIFGYKYGSFLLEVTEDAGIGTKVGTITAEPFMAYAGSKVSMSKLTDLYEGKLESVYACNIAQPQGRIPQK